MIGMCIVFSLKDEVKNQMDQNAVRNHMTNVVALYKKVPGLKEKNIF